MFRNYFRIAFRNLIRQKSYTLVNIFGLALGMAASLLILAYVRVDLTWDRFHKNADRIVRVVELQNFGGHELTDVAVTMPPLGPMLVDELPQVESQVRLSVGMNVLVRHQSKSDYINQIGFTDSTFFQIFTFPLLKGDPTTVLNRPDAIVLSQKTANTLFLNQDPIGKTLEIRGKPLVVTGVMKDLPVNTHIQMDALASFDVLDDGKTNEQWGTNNLATYLMLAPGTHAASLDTSITAAYHRHGFWKGLRFYTQPLSEMHLHSGHIEIDINPGKSDIRSVYTLTSIALLILLVASINFINLATARSVRRSREVGLRKVVGAWRISLIAQFLGESLLLSFFAMIVAAGAVEMALPTFQNMSAREVPLHIFDGGFATFTLLGLMLVTGIFAGLYPAFVLSSYKPAEILRSGRSSGSRRGNLLRRILVIFQFAISIGLLIATGVIYRQASYIQSKPLGYDRHHVLILQLRTKDAQDQAESLRDQFARLPEISSATIASRMPTNGGSQSGMLFEGEDESRMTNMIFCDEHYADVLNLKTVRGHFFSPDYPSEEVVVKDHKILQGAMVVNETAARKAGWDDPIGKTIHYSDFDFPVVGVVKDFHFQSMYAEIQPIVMLVFPQEASYQIALRYSSDNPSVVLEAVREKWDELMPSLPLDYSFLDEQYDGFYRTQIRQATLLESFAGIAIVIAMLGLVGLVSYATERRTREIGVRKVMGASTMQILAIMTREFLYLVAFANLIAWPIAGYVMLRWLQEFAYRAPLAWWLFPLSGLIALALAWLVLLTVTWRATRVNPAEVLRYE